MANLNNRGLAFAASAYFLWGMFPLLMAALAAVGVWEILGHRMVWSLITCLVILALTRRWHTLGAVLKDRRILGRYALAAVLISINWGTFVYAVLINQVSATALGYYINPLLTVAAGVVFFNERLRRGQVIALGLAVCAVVIVAWDLGQVPWISLILAVSFSSYTLVKKSAGAAVNAITGMALETLCLLPAGLLLIFLASRSGSAFGADTRLTILLIGMGVATALVLMLFSAGAARLPLYASGLLQYLSPTMSFILSITYFDEQTTALRWAGFGLIWLALVVISVDAWRALPRRV